VTPTVTSAPALASLLALRAALPEARGPLARLRAAALPRLESLSLPTVREEDWRFTNLKPLNELEFAPARAGATLTLDQIGPYLLPEAAASRLVFVNGHYAPQLSMVSDLHSGVELRHLRDAGSHADLASRHLGRLAGEDAFATLNAASATDGALVVIPRGIAYAAPIHLLFIGLAGDRPVAAHPRVLVVAEADSALTLVEDYVTLGEGVVFTNAVTELVVGDDARLTHVRLQREGREAFHIGRSVAELGRSAIYDQDAASLGARFSRFEPVVVQTAEGMEASLHGLIHIGEGQFADTHSTIDHAQPQGQSRQVQKCVLDGNARAVFNGKIRVRKGAQATNSSQQSRNLLMSERAKIDTKPQLEIFADDVRCAHGATVGQLDPDEVFYLVSRGLSAAEARALLTYAFAAEVIDRIPLASLRTALRARLFAAAPALG
jgi:Fe-S cluster assembly protein SufD